MSLAVLNEVFDRSEAKGTDRNVLAAIADAAHHDGVSWIPIEPPKLRPRTRCITRRANCSKREAIRAIDALVVLGELEVRKAQRGRRRINVYRVAVGQISIAEVDYTRLPFELDRPFGRGDDLAPRHYPAAEAEAGGGLANDPPGRGDDLAPRHESPRGAKSVKRRGASHTRARGNSAFGAETSVLPNVNVSGSFGTSDVPAPSAGEGETGDLQEQLRWALTRELGCKPLTRSEHGAWASAIAELADAAATPEQVADRCAAYRRVFPTARLTATALARHWGFLGAAVDAREESHARTWVEQTSWQLDLEQAHWIVDDFQVDDQERAELHRLVDETRARHGEAAA